MLELVRSRVAMALAAAFAAFWVLGAVLAVIGYAVLSDQDIATTRNLLIAATWLQFTAALVALVAVCAVTWSMVLRHRWLTLWELDAAALSTLLITIGLLVVAANAPQDDTAGNILSAVGIGGWMVLATIRAARYSFDEVANPGSPPRAMLWLMAAAGLLLLLVSVSLPGPSVRQLSLAVVKSVIFAAGVVVLVVTLMTARDRGWIRSRSFPMLAAGLWVFAAAYVGRAVASGIVLGPSATLLGIRIGSAIPAAIVAAAWTIIGSAAWGKVRELSVEPARGHVVWRGTGGPSFQPPAGWYATPGHPGIERWWDGRSWTAYQRGPGAPEPPPTSPTGSTGSTVHRP